MDLLFRLSSFRKADRVYPLQCAETPAAIEELSSLNYPNFANSQYVAAQDKYPEIADPAGQERLQPKTSLFGACGAINVLRRHAVWMINCRQMRGKFVRDIL
jgi:hypothetical protein